MSQFTYYSVCLGVPPFSFGVPLPNVIINIILE
jgi:hypothetical protein